jgi:hypothetical protein
LEWLRNVVKCGWYKEGKEDTGRQTRRRKKRSILKWMDDVEVDFGKTGVNIR